MPKLSFKKIPYLVVIVAICVWQDAYAQPVTCNGSPSQVNKDVAELEDHPQLTPQIVENLQEYLTRCGDTPSEDGRELFLLNIRWLSQASYRFDNNAALETIPQSASTAVWCEQIATLIEQRAKLLDDWHPYENKVSQKVKIGWGLCQEPQTKTNQDLRKTVILWTVDNRRLEREIAKSKQKWQELTADLYRKLPQMAEEAQAREARTKTAESLYRDCKTLREQSNQFYPTIRQACERADQVRRELKLKPNMTTAEFLRLEQDVYGIIPQQKRDHELQRDAQKQGQEINEYQCEIDLQRHTDFLNTIDERAAPLLREGITPEQLMIKEAKKAFAEAIERDKACVRKHEELQRYMNDIVNRPQSRNPYIDEWVYETPRPQPRYNYGLQELQTLDPNPPGFSSPSVSFGEERGWRSYDGVIGPRHQGFGPGGALELGPGGFQSIGPGGGMSIGPGGGLSIGPGGGMSIGPGGGQSIGPGGGRSIGPGGGASIGPGGGLSIGPCGGRSTAPGGGLSMSPGRPGECN